MSDVRMGYLVKFKKKDGVFGAYGEEQRVLMSNEKLAELLTKRVSYYVFSAVSVNVPEYQANHDEKLEEWGFDR